MSMRFASIGLGILLLQVHPVASQDLPCNSLCRAWLGDKAPAENPASVEPAPAPAVAPQAAEVAPRAAQALAPAQKAKIVERKPEARAAMKAEKRPIDPKRIVKRDQVKRAAPRAAKVVPTPVVPALRPKPSPTRQVAYPPTNIEGIDPTPFALPQEPVAPIAPAPVIETLVEISNLMLASGEALDHSSADIMVLSLPVAAAPPDPSLRQDILPLSEVIEPPAPAIPSGPDKDVPVAPLE